MNAYTEFIARLIVTVAVIVLISLMSPFADAQTEKGGDIIDEIWTRQMSPIHIISNIQVVRLTINEGVEIIFIENFEFRVAGILKAQGTKENPIRFSSISNAGWQGIIFDRSPPGSELVWCVVQGANKSAVRITNSNPTFSFCRFFRNTAPNVGGAISANVAEGDLFIESCSFENNTAGASGKSNTAARGGGLYILMGTGILHLSNSNISGNRAGHSAKPSDAFGGGVYVDGNAEVVRTTFINNRVQAYRFFSPNRYTRGGGMFITGENAVIQNCKFLNNTCQTFRETNSPDRSLALGGGVDCSSNRLRMENTIIAQNQVKATPGGKGKATRLGSGLYIPKGEALIVNCSLLSNSGAPALYAHSNSNTEITNSILYSNENQISGSVVITYSDIQDGFAGIGNIDLNPAFDDSFKILPGSSLIDRGNPEEQYNDECLTVSSGSARADLGAHGGPQACGWLVEATPPTNSPPTLANIETSQLVYTEGDDPIIISSDLTVEDPDDSQIKGAIISIDSNFAVGEDILEFIPAFGISGAYVSDSGILNLTGPSSIENYQTVLRSITYKNINIAPSTAVRRLSFVIDDGNDMSTSVVREIKVIDDVSNNDLDSDNLFDIWETENFGDLRFHPHDDSDGDGISNIEEMNANTNPYAIIIEMHKGWNLVSLSMTPPDNSVEIIFGDKILGNVWYWNCEKNGFEITTTISSSKGYWVFSKEEWINENAIIIDLP